MKEYIFPGWILRWLYWLQLVQLVTLWMPCTAILSDLIFRTNLRVYWLVSNLKVEIEIRGSEVTPGVTGYQVCKYFTWGNKAHLFPREMAPRVIALAMGESLCGSTPSPRIDISGLSVCLQNEHKMLPHYVLNFHFCLTCSPVVLSICTWV